MVSTPYTHARRGCILYLFSAVQLLDLDFSFTCLGRGVLLTLGRLMPRCTALCSGLSASRLVGCLPFSSLFLFVPILCSVLVVDLNSSTPALAIAPKMGGSLGRIDVADEARVFIADSH